MEPATREDLVRFVSDVRLLIEGPDGVLNDNGGPLSKETLIRLDHKLARAYAAMRLKLGENEEGGVRV